MRRVSLVRLPFVLVGAVLITAAPSSAQSSADSAHVVLAAWDSMMGNPPYEHPGGATAKVCLDGFQRARSTGQDSLLLVALHRRVRAELERRGHLSVEGSCQSIPATSYGSW